MKRVIYRLHWLLGLTAGSVLIIIGLTGAILCFREEILDALNPGIRVIPAARTAVALSPPALLRRVQQQLPGWRVSRLELPAGAGHSVRISAIRPEHASQTRTLYLNPYNGMLLGEARGAEFLGWVERVHRFLLLPREAGRTVVGSIVSCLLLLMLTGVILRWPAAAHRIRQWLVIDRHLRGRPLWWSLHAVLATWAVPVWLILSVTGIYWAFDGIRVHVDGALGVRYVPHAQRSARQLPDQTPSLDAAWKTFSEHVGEWSWLRIDLAGRPHAVSIFWLGKDAVHERQRNSMQISLDGTQQKLVMFTGQSLGRRGLAAIYPLHMGSYFGMPGRILWACMGLFLAMTGLSGWWLYLLRRRQAREVSRAQQGLALDGSPGGAKVPLLVAYASQTGHAEAVAWRTAKHLKAAGRGVLVRSLAQLVPAELSAYPEALFIVSTYGEGNAPDAAKGFARALQNMDARLGPLRYSVLALGNRQYATYCAFGRFLHQRLQSLGAVPAAEVLCACDTDPHAEKKWLAGLAGYGVCIDDDLVGEDLSETGWLSFTLAERVCLNPGSLGGEIYDIRLLPDDTHLPEWSAGALVEILPRQSEQKVRAWCHGRQLDPGMTVRVGDQEYRLAEWLSRCELPESPVTDLLPDAFGRLPLLRPRKYSVASVVPDGFIRLLVRRYFNAGVAGVASGWLSEACPLQGAIRLRILANPGFAVTSEAVPCLFVGAGSGLAGLLGLLRERVQGGLGDNWLVFGERQTKVDTLCAGELEELVASGLLSLERVYSRNAADSAYVQDRLKAQAERVRALASQGGSIYVCGSLKGMGAAVDGVLRDILGDSCMDDMARQQRYCRDVY